MKSCKWCINEVFRVEQEGTNCSHTKERTELLESSHTAVMNLALEISLYNFQIGAETVQMLTQVICITPKICVASVTEYTSRTGLLQIYTHTEQRFGRIILTFFFFLQTRA